MSHVCDVAKYILKKQGTVSAWKLQKLVYYSQAWSLVWDGRPMFNERIEAWANGPVCPDLYAQHRGQFMVSDIKYGDPDKLDKDAKETIDGVLSYYGDKSPQWLSDLTHAESPWKDARGDLPSGASCQREITQEAMAAYYESLPPAA
ncbi:DUF4065 domain-containing protein [Bradyrhizobium sp. CCGB12]|uniref:Panacea domain-containing protein n=1 Tax=Bradyrhizobium sp. CCGB12 TaxID=2949632 RepID=UPI0020B348D2|nr:type II toxin-antitoxin system antitoxin SocA domain-containing protein [Bradyrhizobium sp. CCGB12]MCP3388894.1 DUF4065 domain-containing protein [Bradyrhizobium sp. CCGB12]